VPMLSRSLSCSCLREAISTGIQTAQVKMNAKNK
jgi:hypothetical protein